VVLRISLIFLMKALGRGAHDTYPPYDYLLLSQSVLPLVLSVNREYIPRLVGVDVVADHF